MRGLFSDKVKLFSGLSRKQKDQARNIFFTANMNDGYEYELAFDGSVICRSKIGRKK